MCPSLKTDNEKMTVKGTADHLNKLLWEEEEHLDGFYEELQRM